MTRGLLAPAQARKPLGHALLSSFQLPNISESQHRWPAPSPGF